METAQGAKRKRCTEPGEGLLVCTIGIALARVMIGLANLVFNMKRLIWLERAAPT